MERFRFFLKKDESSSKEETKEVDSRQSLDLLAEPDSKEVVATKRSMKLAGFFGVDQSQTEVDKMHQMLGSDASQKNLSKRKTLLRKGFFSFFIFYISSLKKSKQIKNNKLININKNKK